MKDIFTLSEAMRALLFLSCLTTTLFPVLYSFSRWNESWIGRSMMFQSIAFAVSLDTRLLLSYFHPAVEVYLWTMAVSLAFISMATTSMSVTLWTINYKK